MKFHCIGCSTVIAIGIGLIVTMLVFLAAVAAMGPGGVSAAKLVLLVTGIISLMLAICCGWEYKNTVVEVKYRWWEFLCTIFFVVAFGCAAVYFGDVLDKDGKKPERNAVHAEP